MRNLNSIKFGYGPYFNYKNENSFFNIAIEPLQKQPKSFFQECQLAALDIHKQALAQNKKILVALSGGIDSECVLRSFIAAEVDVEAVILKFKNDLNWHDVEPAQYLCRLLKVNYTVVELDILQFYNSNKHLHYAENYLLSSPQIATHLWLAEYMANYLNAIPIFSGDIVELEFDFYKKDKCEKKEIYIDQKRYFFAADNWRLKSMQRQDYYAMERMFNEQNITGVANFFMYSTELIAASIKNSSLLNCKLRGRRARNFEIYTEIDQFGELYKSVNSEFYLHQINKNKLKEQTYSHGGFDFLPKYSKWTGFELVHELFSDTANARNGLALSPRNNFDLKIKGMTIFNERYRFPMKKIARQSLLGSVQIHESFYAYIQDTENMLYDLTKETLNLKSQKSRQRA